MKDAEGFIVDYIVPVFISIAVLWGVVSFVMGVYFAFVPSGERISVPLAFLRRVVPLLIAALLVALYLGNVLTGLALFLLAFFLYACALGPPCHLTVIWGHEDGVRWLAVTRRLLLFCWLR